uniref:Uncharacterized protein n=1 Tax=Globodera rostochiensis TaxID=31243 RepID=A0A914GX86_GLORO
MDALRRAEPNCSRLVADLTRVYPGLFLFKSDGTKRQRDELMETDRQLTIRVASGGAGSARTEDEKKVALAEECDPAERTSGCGEGKVCAELKEAEKNGTDGRGAGRCVTNRFASSVDQLFHCDSSTCDSSTAECVPFSSSSVAPRGQPAACRCRPGLVPLSTTDDRSFPFRCGRANKGISTALCMLPLAFALRKDDMLEEDGGTTDAKNGG